MILGFLVFFRVCPFYSHCCPGPFFLEFMGPVGWCCSVVLEPKTVFCIWAESVYTVGEIRVTVFQGLLSH